METGQRIAALREKLSLTQQQLADKMGASRSYLAGIESGLKSPSRKFLRSLKETTGVSVDWLLSGDGKMFPEETEAQGPDSNFRSDLHYAPHVVREPETPKSSIGYGKSERSNFPADPVLTSGAQVGTESSQAEPPESVEVTIVALVVKMLEDWLRQVDRDWPPAVKADAIVTLARMARHLRASGLDDEAIVGQLLAVLRLP